MSKNTKLCAPLSTLLKCASTTTPFPQQRFTSNPSPRIQQQPSLHHAPPRHYPTRDHYYSPLRLFFVKSLCSKSSAEEIQRGCWNCHAVPHSQPFLFCDSCRCIQPLDSSVDYFDIFGLERKYDLGENLEGKYKDWQKKLHPDLVHSKSQLKLYGVEIDEEQTISDPELLAEILDIREAVEEASNSEALNNILSQMQEKLQNWSNAFGHAFQSQNFEEAKMAIRRMTYYSRVIDEVVKKL